MVFKRQARARSRSWRGAFARWVPDDFPEVSVGVAEVAGVDPPRAIVGLACKSRPGLLGLGQQHIHLSSVFDKVSDAQLARLRLSEGNAGVLGEFAAGVEREGEAASEVEHHDRTSCVGLFVDELGGDNATRLQAEAVAVEGE